VSHYLTQRSIYCHGEIGPGFLLGQNYTAQQYAAFHSQIGLALERDLPIVVHSATPRMNALLLCTIPHLRGVFHCFSGNEKQARQLIELGFM
jgi:TatD DNase family protein